MAFILGLPIIILLLMLYKNQSGLYRFSIQESLVFLAIFAVLVVAHELIHGLFWVIYAKNYLKSIEFGFMISILYHTVAVRIC